VTAVEPGSEKPFEDVRDELVQALAHDKAVEVMIDLSTKLEDEMATGSTIEEAGAKLHIPVVSIDGVDATGRAPNGQAVENLPRAPNFLDVAFATPQGEDSHLTEGGTDSYFVVRVDGVTPPVLRPFETVRSDVLASWQAERRKEAARTLANELLQQVASGGTDLAALAASHNLKVEVTEPMLRNAQQGGTQPQALRDIAFATEAGSFGMAEAPSGVYIIRLKEIQPADPAADATGVKRLRDELKAGMEGDLRVALNDALREVYPVSIDRKAVDEAF
jgi:peptidyl-prolyl cis-trans isomerase D